MVEEVATKPTMHLFEQLGHVCLVVADAHALAKALLELE